MSKYVYPTKRINGIKKKIHRIVMEEKLGRELRFNEHVHHLDGDYLNNSPENLVILTKNYTERSEKKSHPSKKS